VFILLSYLWNKWVIAGGLVLAAAGAVFGMIYIFQERLIFYPQGLSGEEAEQLAANDEEVEEMAFQSRDGTILHGWLLQASEEKDDGGLLIYYGGNGEELSGQIPGMKENLPEWSVLLVNYRGYGKNEGSPREGKLYEDALEIFDETKKRYPDKQVVLMGRSIGTAVALKTAAEREVEGMILVSPFDSLNEVAKLHYPFLPIDILLRYSFDSRNRIEEINAPILAMAGGEDGIIPEERTLRLLQEYEGTLHYERISRGGHNDLHFYPIFWDAIREFLSERE
jgi:uncharacterized protein